MSAPRAGQVLTRDEIRETVSRIAAEHGAERVWLYGSWARGDVGPDSDVDLLLDEGDMRTLMDIASFHLDCEDALGCTVDVTMNGALRPRFARRIAADAEVLYERA